MERVSVSNELVKKYEPLVNKIVNQFVKKTRVRWDDIKSMAYEGLVIAFNTYNPERSKMSFIQFAAYAIRNNILTSLDNELRTVKLSNYAQKKTIEEGGSVFNSVSIDQPRTQTDDGVKPREIVMNMVESEKFSNGNVFEYMYMRLEAVFSERDLQIFYRTFGLKEYEKEEKGKDIAKSMSVSEGLVSQRLKKVVKYIQGDRDLCEMLASLVG